MRTSRAWRTRLAACAAVLLAASLRAPTHAFPPGLYRDEAFYGLDGRATLTDGPRLWYPANNGREPLFVWLVALSEWAAAPSPTASTSARIAAVRLPALAASVVLVAALFALAARLAGRRAGLVAAFLVAVLPWATLLGRTGLRAGLLPPVLALAAAATLRGLAAGDRGDGRAAGRWVVGGGALAGLALSTYTAARALPIAVLLALGLSRWAAGRSGRHGRPRTVRSARLAARWTAAAVIAALPLAVAVVRTPGALLGRLRQVAVAGGVEAGAAALGGVDGTAAALLDSAGRTAGMVFMAGDRIARHNIPLRPVFGPAAAALWLLGLIVLVRWLRPGAPPARRRAAAVVVAATLAFALPTALAADAPHFLRAVGALPALVATAAVGGAALVGAVRRRFGRSGAAAAWAVVALAVGLEGRAVVGYDADLAAGRAADPLAARTVPVVPDPAAAVDASPAARWARAYHAFDGAATTLARAVSADLRPDPASAGGRVWLDRRLRDGWASVPYLVDLDAVTLTDPYDPVLASDGTAYLVPYGLRLDEVWAQLPAAADLVIHAPVPERGDQAPHASPLYVRVDGPRADPSDDAPTWRGAAAFAGGPTLTEAVVWAEPPPAAGPADPHGHRAVYVATRWRRGSPGVAGGDAGPAAGDVTPYIHLLGAPSDAVPQRRVDGPADTPLGHGVYPVGRWRPGDGVTDVRTVWLPGSARGARLAVGLYAGDPGAPLRRTGGVDGDGLTVDIGAVP